MADIYKPLSYIQLFAVCIDDSKPKFEPDDWITNNRLYRVVGFTEPLNQTEGQALIISDSSFRELHPSPSHWSFKSDRFVIFDIVLN